MRLNRHALKEIRESRGFSVSELARRSGSDQSYLSRVEAGKRNASPKLCIALADALKTPLAAILADPDDWEPRGARR